MDKQRFNQLYALAHGGDLNAKADLWLEFEFDYDQDPLPFIVSQASSLPCQKEAVADRTPNNRNAEGGAPC